VHPFDDPAVLNGQGTVGLEILAALPMVRTIVVPVGGGGLIAGIAVAVNNEVVPRGTWDSTSIRGGDRIDGVRNPARGQGGGHADQCESDG